MLRTLPRVIVSCLLVTGASQMWAQAPAYTGGSKARPLITGPIDEARLTVLAGNTNPHATTKNDRGAFDESFPLNHLQLQLQRPPELEKSLESLMQEQQEKTSPNYHKWLTAAEFGEKYGVSPSDVAKVENWLNSHGFRVESVAPSGMFIDFSGTAGQVKQAFHTEIHRVEVDGVKHIANMTDPMIPAALASVVKGVVSLNDFMPHPMYKKRAKYTAGGGSYTLVPADLATIYNLNPAFAKGITGSGQTVVVIEDTDVYSADDISTFRSTFGLSSYQGTFTQVNPTGSNTCDDPGVVPDNEAEAELDAEWAGASAPGASVVLASCTDTQTAFGGLIALQNLIQGTSVPAIVSISYGECESENGASQNAAYLSTYQQAAAEGVSVFVSAGDEGAASCDAELQNATHGISVSGFASTPYNVAVGGTDYADTFLGTNADYWSNTNSSTFGSALSYIPEIPWNDSCASQLLATFNGYAATYGANGFCNSNVAQDDADLTTGAGSGGPSTCYSLDGHGNCVGQPKPAWQVVLGNPADTVRDIPDVSLFAAAGTWAHYYVYCDSDIDDSGNTCDSNPNDWSGAGGTSFSSPILAGVQALMNQAAGSKGWGNPNPRLYALGSIEYGSAGSPNCNSSKGSAVASTCVFYDVTMGDMDVNCTGTDNCYLPSGSYGVLSTSNSTYSPAYGTQTGWDFATGLGTINAYNLIRDWVGVQTSTAVTSSQVPADQGVQVTYTATITPEIGNTETGHVTWSTNTGCKASTISSGVAQCKVTWQNPGAQATVTATYGGDSNYAASNGSFNQAFNVPAALTAPQPGSTFGGSSATFTWSAATNATGYYLWIGTSGVGSNNLYNSALKTGTSYTFTSLPYTGVTIYVRLITNFNGTWVHNDYQYTAAAASVITSPTPGSALPGPSVTFNWTNVSSSGENLIGYYLWIGTTGVGSNNLYNSALKTGTTYTFSKMPITGQTIYVRLITNIGGKWVSNDYQYIAASLAAMTTPTSGSAFTSSTVTFNWSAGEGATGYYLWIGTTSGGNDLYNSALKAPSVTSYTFTKMPTNGEPIYVRLITNLNGVWYHNDYTYTAAN